MIEQRLMRFFAINTIKYNIIKKLIFKAKIIYACIFIYKSSWFNSVDAI